MDLKRIVVIEGDLRSRETTFTYEAAASDVPRLTDSRISAHNWTGVNGVPAQVITTYSVAGDGACVMTTPDGTVYTEYYGTGWQRGLTTLSEVWSGGVRQKWTTIAWTQDNTSVGYEVNPRVTETNVYDTSGNRRRVVIDYGPYPQWGLPYRVKEYAADGVTEVRHTITDYNLGQAYLDRRIIGLVSEAQLTSGSQPQSRVTYSYDDPARLHGVPAAATQHDANYNPAFTVRGNVTAVSRWDLTDVNNSSKRLTNYTNYYNTGTAISTTDPAGHQSSIAYTDSFSDSVIRNTFAYPTTMTDADGFSSYIQYNFDFGATARTQSPAPAGQLQGAIRAMTYNNRGQLERTTTTNNGAYTRFWYGADFTASYATVNNVADESYSVQTFDGLGRPVAAASNHPGSTGLYKAQLNVYDLMGRVKKVSNPAEITSSWAPAGDDAAGWLYTQQTYDWQGRPLVTTNPDNTTREAGYAGCGCAGGEVVTLTDEGTIDAGVVKRRQRKIYSDVFGRTVKTEMLDWQGGSVYSATVNTYNARDQVTQVRQYAGAEGSGTYRDTTMTYDGYGRLKTTHVPEQDPVTATTWAYNADDTIQKVTDARRCYHYAYNNRHLTTGVSYAVPPGSQISVPTAATFSYDAAGNRSTMTDGVGTTNYSYDSLSRMTSESRTFTNVGSYSLDYSYNLANALTLLAIPFRSRQIGYNYDIAGRLSGVTAMGFSATYNMWPNQYTQNLTSFASNITYRAWGARKSMTYGNTTSEQTSYNARLQPTSYTLNNMNYQNTNVCCSYPTYNTMTWNYGYYDDGTLEHAWDTTNEWFDRAYKYDHAGRLKEASTFRRARGLTPYPAINYPDPYFQSITYDAFNHSNRTGKLYTGEPSDVGTYVNNRRIDFAWQYDADGNTISDSSYQTTIDAAGKTTRSVSHATVGDGLQYPIQPRLDITQTYDGTGQPAQRVQISRLPGIVDEFGNPGEPIVDTQTTHYIKSTVLGGATVAELGWGDTIHIYAGGKRIAREFLGNVTFEHHNPATGSWVTSHGHSSYRTTNREERDPRGAETPLSNPYTSAQSYVDWKFSQPLFIEGGDPFDYSSGREIDGLPVSEQEFQRRVGSGAITLQKTDGRGNVFLASNILNLGSSIWIDDWTITHSVSNTDFPLIDAGDGTATMPDPKHAPTVTIKASNAGYFITASAGLRIANYLIQRSNLLQPPPFDILGIRKGLQDALKRWDCREFVNDLLEAAKTKANPLAKSGHIMTLFESVVTGKSFTRNPPAGSAGFGSPIGRIANNTAGIFLFGSAKNPQLLLHDTMGTLHELMHHAGLNSYYTDALFARIVNGIPQYAAVARRPFPLDGVDNKTRRELLKDEGDTRWGGYWGDVLRQKCFE